MRILTLVLMAAIAPACSSDPSPSVDAPKAVDAKLIDAKLIDTPGGAVCTGLVYDSCNMASSNCGTGLMCKTFSGAGFSVCSPACSAQAPCPNQGSTTIACNGNGLCKPPAPNSDCTSP
jgi:hypothetical protein